MKKKQTIRLNESQFNNFVTKIVTESVKKVLKESINEYDFDKEDELLNDYLKARTMQIKRLIELKNYLPFLKPEQREKVIYDMKKYGIPY